METTKRKILVVDDEPDFLRLIKSRLESEGYDVCAVAQSREAIKESDRFRPDVVLLDVHMPEVDGLSILKQLRKRSKTLPIFILTATADGENFAQANRLDASGFIQKTGDLSQGLKVIASAVRLASKYRS
jgi:CheY-like chemotaxis protein